MGAGRKLRRERPAPRVDDLVDTSSPAEIMDLGGRNLS